MNESALLSIATTGFIVAFLHAALPTHWLPFVLAGRGQGWTKSKTLLVATFASLGHVIFTTILGVLLVLIGIHAHEWFGHVFSYIAGALLILIGLYYLRRQAQGRSGHHHWQSHSHESHYNHVHHDHAHCHGNHHSHEHAYSGQRSDWAVIAGLLALLTFSPCEGFLPVYLSGIAYGWTGFIVLSGILALGTTGGMVLFTWLTLTGLERFQLKVLERYEAGILGALLCVLGVLVMILEH